jgi:hypothetical protein
MEAWSVKQPRRPSSIRCCCVKRLLPTLIPDMYVPTCNDICEIGVISAVRSILEGMLDQSWWDTDLRATSMCLSDRLACVLLTSSIPQPDITTGGVQYTCPACANGPDEEELDGSTADDSHDDSLKFPGRING